MSFIWAIARSIPGLAVAFAVFTFAGGANAQEDASYLSGYSSGVVGPRAASRLDFGGGYKMGYLINKLDPELTGGGYSTGLVTSRFKPFTFAEGRGKISLWGQFNNGYIKVDNNNPTEDNSNFATNGASTNFLGIRGRYQVNEDFRIGARLSFSAAFDRTDLKNDFNDDAGCNSQDLDKNFCLFDANFYIGSKSYGRLTLGLGETAFAGIGDINLGGVTFATNANPSVKAGYHEVFGLFDRFADVALDPSGVTRGTAVRYDSPTIAGFVVSGSWGEADHSGAPGDADGTFYDVALRYAGEFGAFRVAAGAGYQNYDREGDGLNQSNLTGAASIQHIPTGIYVTGSATRGTRDADFNPGKGEDNTATAYYAQVGITQKWFSLGKTSIFGEYGQTNGGANAGAYFWDNSETNNFGLGIVQQIDSAAMSLYATYNHVEAKVEGTSGDNMDIYMVGTRIKF